MLRGSKENYLQLKFCTLKCSFFSIVDMLEFLFISVGTSARNWSGWMKAWGRRTWQYMWGEIMCLRTRTGSCIVRAQRTWRTGCKASLLCLSACLLNSNPLNLIHSPSLTGTLFLKGRRVRMLVACWGNGTWSSPGRCSTQCMPCSALHQGIVSPIP